MTLVEDLRESALQTAGADLDNFRISLGNVTNELIEAADHIEKIEAENAELRGVLAWYGDEENHNLRHVVAGKWVCPVDEDQGQRARDSIGQREVKDAE